MLPEYTQEDVLALIGWREEANRVLTLLSVDAFSVAPASKVNYQVIARAALSFWQEFRAPPKDHLVDLVLAQTPDLDQADVLNVLRGLSELAPRLNLAYIEQRLLRFLRREDMRGRLYRAIDLLAQDKLDDAQETLTERTSFRELSKPLSFGSLATLSNYLLNRSESRYLCGIEPLDRFGIGPARKEMYLVMAPAKRGKSWWLIHLAKQALLARARVLHITLEMRREQVLQRYTQSFMAVGKRPLEATRVARFARPEHSLLARGIEFDPLGKVEGLLTASGEINSDVFKRADRLQERFDLRIEEFPSRSTTVSDIESCMDRLEREERFVADMVVLDYGDLLKVNAERLRTELSARFIELRALAQTRNVAMVTATQTNRQSLSAALVTEAHTSEDYSKIMTADYAITYSQTPVEKKLGVARLYVAAGRDEQDKQVVLISQNYGIGQFCLDAAWIPGNWDQLTKVYATDEDDETVEEAVT